MAADLPSPCPGAHECPLRWEYSSCFRNGADDSRTSVTGRAWVKPRTGPLPGTRCTDATPGDSRPSGRVCPSPLQTLMGPDQHPRGPREALLGAGPHLTEKILPSRRWPCSHTRRHPDWLSLCWRPPDGRWGRPQREALSNQTPGLLGHSCSSAPIASNLIP